MPGLLALDVGDRRIGMAASEWADLVTPIGVIPRGPGELEAIRRHVEERFIEKVVVGLPISLNDTIGPQAKKTLQFIERLKAVVTVPVETYDERFTTRDAEEKLLSLDVSRTRRRQTVDAQAAAEILKGYLADRAERNPEIERPLP
jgi:putative Holliday junction resolvase